MNRFHPRIAGGILCCLLLVGMAAPTHADSPAVAPAWSLQTPTGETVRFPEDAGGRPSVLMFWPSWCPYSRALQPYVQRIWEDYRDQGVNVWTLNIKEVADPVETLRERGLSFPLLLKADALMHPYGIERTPWLVVVDGDNRIVYTRPANPPTPIDVAKAVRRTLNDLLGPDQAVPLPTRYPPPYDLHLKSAKDVIDRPVPAAIPEEAWLPWVTDYLAGVGHDERVDGVAPRGSIAGGKTAIAIARDLWAASYGDDATRQQAPYRAFRKGNYWVVVGVGEGQALGEGMVLVLTRDRGEVVRIQWAEPPR